MKCKTINRFMIAGTHSGCGKTTVTCAILKALKNRGLDVASYKCGPDYIDPMFHSEIIGTASRNIDFFLCGETAARSLFAKNSCRANVSIAEGVMGFYDGLGGNSSENSSWDISNRFGIPVVLVVHCKGASASVAAMVKGYLELYENRIRAVILNHVSKPMYPIYKDMLEKQLGICVAGYMPHEPAVSIEDRHLGLVTAKEIESLKHKIDMLAETAEETIDLDCLLEIAQSAEPFDYEEIEIPKAADVKIAVARDKAFCFYYQDSLDLLESMGAKLLYFSPAEDQTLPGETDGLILGGGYPELYLDALSQNLGMIRSIRDAERNGMPIFAECGGFMYLGKSIGGHPMTGIADLSFEMTGKLQNFGYVELTARENTGLLGCGETAYAHEFHYSKNDAASGCLTAMKSSGKTWEAGYCKDNVFALYPHIHFWGNREMASRFIEQCKQYQTGKVKAQVEK
jgi:cobyrinic acid a,c-diamide synthase